MNICTRTVVACFVLQLLPAVVLAYSTGAPTQACSTLMPSHGVSSQAASSLPYMIDMDVFRHPSTGELFYIPGFSYNSKIYYSS